MADHKNLKKGIKYNRKKERLLTEKQYWDLNFTTVPRKARRQTYLQSAEQKINLKLYSHTLSFQIYRN